MKPTRPATQATPDDSQDLGPIEALVMAVLKPLEGLPKPVRLTALFRAIRKVNDGS